MDLKEHLSKLRSLSANITTQAVNSIFVPAANRLLAETKNRIINEGVASDGTQIGQYSTKPSYYTRDQFVKKSAFKPIGKTGNRKFKNGKPHKSMYVQSGYSGLRSLQGRQVAFVNSDYSGSLMADYVQNVRQKEIVHGFTNKQESNKRKGLEQRYGKKIYASTPEQIEAYKVETLKGIKEFTLKTLR